MFDDMFDDIFDLDFELDWAALALALLGAAGNWWWLSSKGGSFLQVFGISALTLVIGYIVAHFILDG